MHYSNMRTDPRLSTVLLSPFDRVLGNELSISAKLTAAVVAIVQCVGADAFSFAFLLLIASGAADYWFGTRIAKLSKSYNPSTASSGAMGKLSGIVLVGFLRAVEYWLGLNNVIHTHGLGAALVTMSLLLVDLQSIAHHREELGATPLPVIGKVIAWILSVISSKVPPAVPDPDNLGRRVTDPPIDGA